MCRVSVVLPAYNEALNLEVLLPQLLAVLEEATSDFSVVIVDDGSTDKTGEALAGIVARSPAVQMHRSRRNRGKSNALRDGFALALAEAPDAVVMMDADGQDDPREIPKLLVALDDETDLVTGARLVRQDAFIKRNTSKVYNRATGLLTGCPGRDFNSGFKAMKAPLAEELGGMLYGELHRYITVIAYWLGYSVAEVPVTHRARLHGRTKYGVNRFWRGFFDLITVRFLMSYVQRPSHLFGGVGIGTLLLGLAILGYLLVEKVMGASIGGRPLLLTGVLLVVVGLQLFLFGLLAELIVFANQRRDRETPHA